MGFKTRGAFFHGLSRWLRWHIGLLRGYFCLSCPSLFLHDFKHGATVLLLLFLLVRQMRVVGDLVELGKLGVGTSKCRLVDVKAALAAIDTTETCETWPAGTADGG